MKQNGTSSPLLATLLTVVTLLVFARVATFEFTTWDDGLHLYQNPLLNPPTAAGVLAFWKQPYEGLYIPVTYTLWTAVAALTQVPTSDEFGTGLNPYAFHLLNLLLHLLAVLVVWRILRLLVEKRWPAAAGALLFAVHPIQTEPVAWISGMRDVLGGLLGLAAIWQYLLYQAARPALERRAMSDERRVDPSPSLTPRPSSLHYALATVLFALALLAKPTAVVVPAIAFVLVWCKYRPPLRTALLPLVPWALLAIGPILITRHLQAHVVLSVTSPLWARPLVAADSLGFYLYKLLVPIAYGPDYGRTPEYILQHNLICFTWIAPVAVGVLLLGLWRRNPDYRWPLAAAAVLLFGVAPVLGLTPFEFQQISTVADRYLYLSMLGPALAAAWLLARWPGRATAAVAAAVLCALALRTIAQTGSWENSFALYQGALAANPNSWIAHHNLAIELGRRGQVADAIPHYRKAAEVAPGQWLVHDSLASALRFQARALHRQNQPAEADRLDAEAASEEAAAGRCRAALGLDPRPRSPGSAAVESR